MATVYKYKRYHTSAYTLKSFLLLCLPSAVTHEIEAAAVELLRPAYTARASCTLSPHTRLSPSCRPVDDHQLFSYSPLIPLRANRKRRRSRCRCLPGFSLHEYDEAAPGSRGHASSFTTSLCAGRGTPHATKKKNAKETTAVGGAAIVLPVSFGSARATSRRQ